MFIITLIKKKLMIEKIYLKGILNLDVWTESRSDLFLKMQIRNSPTNPPDPDPQPWFKR